MITTCRFPVRTLQRLVVFCALYGLTAACAVGCGDDDGPASPVGGFGASDGGGTGGTGATGGGGVGADGGAGTAGSAGTIDASFDGAVDGSDNDSGAEDAASVVPAPDGWLCHDRLYQDGHCDCGCGVTDADCLGAGCTDPGCMEIGCEACFGTNGGWIPCNPPAWECEPEKQADPLGICDCGCGGLDPDCQGRGCGNASCRSDACDRCHDEGGAVTDCALPIGWSCGRSSYADGTTCDCGCGVADPDCAGAGCVDGNCREAACSVCRAANGDQVPCSVPVEWACNPAAYGSDDGCDCGCGVADPDCGNGGCASNSCTDSACDACHFDTIIASCTIPSAWTCHPAFYARNGICDCGCGAPDPDCASEGCVGEGCTANGCDLCHGAAGAFGDCGGWTCDVAHQGTNDGCDCGCSATDPDCFFFPSCTEPGCEVDGCERCNDVVDEEAVHTACGPRWACTLPQYGDGFCDCGCGIPDPDCGDGGCTERGCFEATCAVCRDAEGTVIPCDVGLCGARNLGTGDGCDCGCEVPDADCNGLSACTTPGCSASACARCRDPLGRLINCL